MTIIKQRNAFRVAIKVKKDGNVRMEGKKRRRKEGTLNIETL